MANILCVLYDDPVDGYPSSYARDDIPTIESYYDGQTAPTPEATEVVAYPPEEIPWSEIAFTTTLWALRDWLALRRPDLEAPAVSSGR